MKPLRKSLAILLLTFALLAVPVRLHAADDRRYSYTFLYTPLGHEPFTVTVPRTTDGLATVAIPVSDTGKWIVTVGIDREAKFMSVTAVDPTLGLFAGRDNSVPPVVVFRGTFDIVYGKPIPIVRSSSYLLEVTLSAE